MKMHAPGTDLPLETADYEVPIYYPYCPPGVQRVIATGSSAFIGTVDDATILKYPMEPGGDMSELETEHQILTIVGRHPRIIGHKGFTEAGLYLERAVNGSVYWYLTESGRPTPSLQQRVTWCRQLVEAIEHTHSRRVIHCDIQPTNILLDENLSIKLADFQGMYVAEDGKPVLEGESCEPCRYYCPREDDFHSDVKTDLFALGSTIYYIVTGHEVFPDIAYGAQGWREAVEARFANKIFPEDPHLCAAITRKCWECQYDSATEVLVDFKAIESTLS